MAEHRGMGWKSGFPILVVLVVVGLPMLRHRLHNAAPNTAATAALSTEPDGGGDAPESARGRGVRPAVNSDRASSHSTLWLQEGVIELLPGDGGEPPLMAYAGVSRDVDTQLIGILARCEAVDRNKALQSGRQLLECTNGLLRALGAAILCQHDGLTPEVLLQLVKDADPAVPLTALGWLGDAGRLAEAERLFTAWKANGLNSDALRELAGALESGELGSIGGRAALRILKRMYPADQLREALAAITKGGKTVTYSLKMTALWMEKSLLDVGAFQERLHELARQSSPSRVAPLSPRAAGSRGPFNSRRTAMQGGKPDKLPDSEDELWQQGLSRWVSRFHGPTEVVQSQPLMCPQYVDEVFARRNPVMLEDLAVWVESATSDASAPVLRGSASRVATHLGTLPANALSDEQKYAMARIQARLGSLAAMEKDLPGVGPFAPPE